MSSPVRELNSILMVGNIFKSTAKLGFMHGASQDGVARCDDRRGCQGVNSLDVLDEVASGEGGRWRSRELVAQSIGTHTSTQSLSRTRPDSGAIAGPPVTQDNRTSRSPRVAGGWRHDEHNHGGQP